MQKELEAYQEEIKDMSDEEEEEDSDDEEEEEEEEENDIPSEMTEEEKMEVKLRNMRLGNTEETESESEEEVVEEEEDDESAEEELSEEAELARRGEKIERLNNRDFKAHRDVKPKKSTKKLSVTAAAAAKDEELKSKVARTLKSQTNKQNVRNTRGNNLKNKGKRSDRAAVKGGDIFD